MPHLHHHEKSLPTTTGTARNDPVAEVGTHFEEPPSQKRKRDQMKDKMRRGPHLWHVRKAENGPHKLAIKNHFVAMVGEFVGTTLFLLIAFGGTNIANVPQTSVTGATTGGQDGSTAAAVNTSSLLYIALSFGFSLAVNAWIFFRISGGLFNPAVSLGMVLVGALTPLRGALLTFAQILGGICGAAIIQALTPGTLNIRTQLGGGINTAQGLFYEAFLTCALMLAILLLAAEKSKATFLAPVGIGLALFIAEMAGVYYTGGSLNPARSFGPDVVLHSFDSYHWIYWLGPALGATFAAGFYRFIKYLEYETVLGPETADSDDEDAPVKKGAAPDLTSAGAGGAPGMLGGGAPGMLDNTAEGSMLGGMDGEHAKRQEAKSDARRGSAIPGLVALQAALANSRRGSAAGIANVGPGLGDLLTHGDPANAYDLEENNGEYYDARLDRIEALLQQLLAGRSPTGAQATAVTSRSSDDTLEGEDMGEKKAYTFPETSTRPIPNANARERDLADVEAGRGNLDQLAGHISREELARRK